MRTKLLLVLLPLTLMGACSQSTQNRLGTAAEQAKSGVVAVGSATKTAVTGFSQAYSKLKQSWNTATNSDSNP